MFSQIFLIGLSDSVNPCALTTILLFFLYLCYPIFGYARPIKTGLIYLLCYVGFNTFIIIGLFDNFLVKMDVIEGVRILFFLIAGGFMAFGLLHFIDWIRAKKKGSSQFLIKNPTVLAETKVEKKANEKYSWFRKAGYSLCHTLITVIFAFVMSTLSSAWSPNYLLYAKYSFFYQFGNIDLAVLTLLTYSGSFGLPLFLMWLFFIVVNSSSKVKKMFNQHILLTKLIVSASFLSVGSGLIYIFMK